jgi:hypothetical protein
MSLANYLIDRKGDSLYENVALLPIANCQHGEISSRLMAIIFNLAPKSPAASASGRSDLITATSCTYEIYRRAFLVECCLFGRTYGMHRYKLCYYYILTRGLSVAWIIQSHRLVLPLTEIWYVADGKSSILSRTIHHRYDRKSYFVH